MLMIDAVAIYVLLLLFAIVVVVCVRSRRIVQAGQEIIVNKSCTLFMLVLVLDL